MVLRAGKVLISKRGEGTDLAGFWEFPGGKCEPGESPPACLRRELLEEVGLHVQPLHPFTPITFTYPNATVRLHPFLCASFEGTARPYASDEVKWVSIEDLSQVPFPPANNSLLQELAAYVKEHPELRSCDHLADRTH